MFKSSLIACVVQVLSIVFVLQVGQAAFAFELQIVSEEFPPYNYTDKSSKSFVGISTDIVKAALDKANVKYHIDVLPWARAYNVALHRKNTAIYSITRIPQREDLFIWIKQLETMRLCLFKLSSREDISIQGKSDLKKYRIGGVRGTAEVQFLVDAGYEFSEWDLVNSHDTNIEKLAAGRVDMIIWDENSFCHGIKSLGKDAVSFKREYCFTDGVKSLYIALNLGSDEELVSKLKDAFKDVK